jgi:putative transposase
MRQSTFTETQIVSMLKEADAGRPVHEIWRKYGISSATYYKWKANQTDVCGPLLGECRAEGCTRKKALRPAERREVVAHMIS